MYTFHARNVHVRDWLPYHVSMKYSTSTIVVYQMTALCHHMLHVYTAMQVHEAAAS